MISSFLSNGKSGKVASFQKKKRIFIYLKIWKLGNSMRLCLTAWHLAFCFNSVPNIRICFQTLSRVVFVVEIYMLKNILEARKRKAFIQIGRYTVSASLKPPFISLSLGKSSLCKGTFHITSSVKFSCEITNPMVDQYLWLEKFGLIHWIRGLLFLKWLQISI